MNRPWLLGFAMTFWALAGHAGAQDAIKIDEPSGPLYADVIDIAPWGRAGPDGRPAGVYASVFKRLSELSACPMEQRLTPIPRAVAEVIRNAAQATIMLDREDLDAGAVEVGEVTRLQIEVWLPKGSRLRTLQDLAGKSVGVLRGPSYSDAFDSNVQIQKNPVTTPQNQLEMLLKGRLDGAVGVRENFMAALSAMNLRPDAFATPIFLEHRIVKLWVSPSLRGSRCAVRFTKALSDLRRSGEVDRLIVDAISFNPPSVGTTR
jgi:ABC-type amino acid transport substrate-binding protein